MHHIILGVKFFTSEGGVKSKHFILELQTPGPSLICTLTKAIFRSWNTGTSSCNFIFFTYLSPSLDWFPSFLSPSAWKIIYPSLIFRFHLLWSLSKTSSIFATFIVLLMQLRHLSCRFKCLRSVLPLGCELHRERDKVIHCFQYVGTGHRLVEWRIYSKQ